LTPERTGQRCGPAEVVRKRFGDEHGNLKRVQGCGWAVSDNRNVPEGHDRQSACLNISRLVHLQRDNREHETESERSECTCCSSFNFLALVQVLEDFYGSSCRKSVSIPHSDT